MTGINDVKPDALGRYRTNCDNRVAIATILGKLKGDFTLMSCKFANGEVVTRLAKQLTFFNHFQNVYQ